MWKRFSDGLPRLRVELEAPDDVRGSRLLVVDQAEGPPLRFVYLPELRRVRRLSRRDMETRLLGTALTLEDLEVARERLQDAQLQRMGETTVQGRRVSIIEVLDWAGEPSRFRRARVFLDPERCLPLRVEFFDETPDPRMVLVLDSDSVSREQGVYVGHRATLRDLLDGTETTILLESFDSGVTFPDELFAPERLGAAVD